MIIKICSFLFFSFLFHDFDRGFVGIIIKKFKGIRCVKSHFRNQYEGKSTIHGLIIKNNKRRRFYFILFDKRERITGNKYLIYHIFQQTII